MKYNFNILLIDDDEDDRHIFMTAVAEIDVNIQCNTANDGLEALKILEQKDVPAPDIIFLDLNMPRLDGKQFLAERNKIEKLVPVPIIVFSTTKRQEDVEAVKKLGAFDFITKPVKYKQICDEISRALNKVRESYIA